VEHLEVVIQIVEPEVQRLVAEVIRTLVTVRQVLIVHLHIHPEVHLIPVVAVQQTLVVVALAQVVAQAVAVAEEDKFPIMTIES
jgi:hypothetical protein